MVKENKTSKTTNIVEYLYTVKINNLHKNYIYHIFTSVQLRRLYNHKYTIIQELFYIKTDSTPLR